MITNILQYHIEGFKNKDKRKKILWLIELLYIFILFVGFIKYLFVNFSKETHAVNWLVCALFLEFFSAQFSTFFIKPFKTSEED